MSGKIVVFPPLVEQLACSMARFSNHNPYLQVSNGVLPTVEVLGNRFHVTPSASCALWELYEPLARQALAAAAELIGAEIEFVTPAAA
jgi:hypothetical protein